MSKHKLIKQLDNFSGEIAGEFTRGWNADSVVRARAASFNLNRASVAYISLGIKRANYNCL